MLKPNLCKVFACHALTLLDKLPTESIHAVITDPMYMVATTKTKKHAYDWGMEPGHGLAEEFWDYHQRIYDACRRVLIPGGRLAWAMGAKHEAHFRQWFGGYRIWGLNRYFIKSVSRMNHIWLVQSKEQAPIRQPDVDALVRIGPRGWWRHHHRCAKSEEEMRFLVGHLTKPGQIVVDCFAGSGSTLVSAEQLGRLWIGCDLSPRYCMVAMKRLAALRETKCNQPPLTAG